MKASDLFVKALENEGVEYIFGLPGEENLDLLESLRKSNIKWIPVRHESGAGFMAAAYGRLTGKAGVALSTLGPGATNLVTAAAHAQLGGMPVLFITAQKPFKNNKQGLFQQVSTVDVFKPVTKSSKQILDGHSIPKMVSEAFKTAEQERPGAVHLQIPQDVASTEIQSSEFITKTEISYPVAEQKTIEEAVKMIEVATSPIILVGAAANRKPLGKVLSALLEKAKIPFVTTQMGKGAIDERNPLYLGTVAVSQSDYIHATLKKCDLIISIGYDTFEKPSFITEGKPKILHINFFQADPADVYFPDLDVIGHIEATLTEINKEIFPNSQWSFADFFKIKEALEKQQAEDVKKTFPISPQELVRALRKIMPDDGVLSLDTGMYKIWFGRNYRAYQPNTLLIDNALATMGAGLPAAIAAKLVYPSKKVAAVCGDGGLMMSVSELETAVRLKLDLVVLVLNDSGYGMIKWEQGLKNFPSFGLDFGNPDFAKLAESFGAKGLRVKSGDDLEKLLQDALNSKGVCVLEVPIDYSESNKLFFDELKALTANL